jgi:hypothetical protein
MTSVIPFDSAPGAVILKEGKATIPVKRGGFPYAKKTAMIPHRRLIFRL